MKEKIINSLKQLVADRYLLVLLSLSIVFTIVFAIIVGLAIQPSERQLISHYSAFGVTRFYFEQWFYLFVFVAFGIVSSILHVIISIKMLVTKGHSIAVMFAWYGIGMVIFSWVMASKILELQALL